MAAGTPWRNASALMFCRQAWKSPSWAHEARPGAASAVVAAKRMILQEGSCRRALSRAGDGHPSIRTVGALVRALELQVVGRRQVEEHVLEVAGHRDAAHRPGELAVLDPEARGAAAVVAGDAVDAEADQVGDVEAALDVGRSARRPELALLEIEVRRGGRGRSRRAARGVAGRLAA